MHATDSQLFHLWPRDSSLYSGVDNPTPAYIESGDIPNGTSSMIDT